MILSVAWAICLAFAYPPQPHDLEMVSIGFRASPSRVTYAIVRGTSADGFQLISTSAVNVPPALETPRQLQFVRTALLDVMDEYGTTRAGLRTVENVAKTKNPFRMNLEGVIQEVLASSTVEHFEAAALTRIAALLGYGRDVQAVKRLISGEASPELSANWSDLRAEEREAVLIAVAAASVDRGLRAGELPPIGGAAS